MINKLLLTTWLMVLSAGFCLAQNDTINQLDSLDRRQGYWITSRSFIAENGFPTEGKIEEGIYIDNSKEG